MPETYIILYISCTLIKKKSAPSWSLDSHRWSKNKQENYVKMCTKAYDNICDEENKAGKQIGDVRGRRVAIGSLDKAPPKKVPLE